MVIESAERSVPSESFRLGRALPPTADRSRPFTSGLTLTVSRAPRPPPGLEAEILDVEGADLAVLSWPIRPPARLPALTSTETEVVRLALQGLSNAAIGRRRGRAERTIANQLASAFRKLGVGSRAELAALVARGGDGR